MRSQVKRSRGFTLVELLIAVAIVGILARVAYPAYTSSVQKSRRAEAISKLLELQMMQERYRVKQAAASYATTMTLLTGAATLATSYYTYAMTANATTFTITATATGAQANDTVCDDQLIIKETGPDLGDATKKTCWGR